MNKSLYPENWSEIRHHILSRDFYQCTRCPFKHRDYVLIESPGVWLKVSKSEYKDLQADGLHVFRVYLQVAHLNNIKSDCRDENLISLCPLCHLMFDAPWKALLKLSSK